VLAALTMASTCSRVMSPWMALNVAMAMPFSKIVDLVYLRNL